MTQKALNEAFARMGADKTLAGRVERGTVTFGEMHGLLFAKALRVPLYWFTEPDVDAIVGMKPPPTLSAEELSAMLARLQAGHVQATDQALPEMPTRQAGAGRPPRAPGGTSA
jgi:hypothetical protein